MTVLLNQHNRSCKALLKRSISCMIQSHATIRQRLNPWHQELTVACNITRQSLSPWHHELTVACNITRAYLRTALGHTSGLRIRRFPHRVLQHPVEGPRLRWVQRQSTPARRRSHRHCRRSHASSPGALAPAESKQTHTSVFRSCRGKCIHLTATHKTTTLRRQRWE